MENPESNKSPEENVAKEAFEAQRWIEAELVNSGVTKEDSERLAAGTKNEILRLTLTGQNRGLSPMEMAQNYLEKIKLKK